MNSDLIKKLIKLANNNPNDNEANSAARRVCKMLADYEFKDNEVYKSESYDQGPSESTQSQYDYILNIIKVRNQNIWEPSKRQQEYYHDNKSPYDIPKKPKTKGTTTDYKKAKTIKCSKCHEDIETEFVGPPQIFVCTRCIFFGNRKNDQNL